MKLLNNKFTNRGLSILIILINGLVVFGQSEHKLKWWNPVEDSIVAIEGQAWGGETKNPYDRLPARAEKSVRKAVWDLSKNSAGLIVRFKTNAEKIVVKYKVSEGLSMSHMPSSGKSGVDLYAESSNGEWLWCAAQRNFGDTITYTFRGIKPSDSYKEEGLEYKLYLPPYNTVEWLKIGVPSENSISGVEADKQKPIVVYGTSIAQGACASRPGMMWTALVGRAVNTPVINLGFSGNGKLEKEVIKLISEIDAQLFVLDCMPNMTAPRFTSDEVKERIIFAVNFLQQKHPNTPILLTEHDGYTDWEMRPERFKNYNDINITLRSTFKELKQTGIKDIYLLPQSEINLDIDCQVDGIHPNDLGMYRYAIAYSKYIKVILGLHD